MNGDMVEYVGMHGMQAAMMGRWYVYGILLCLYCLFVGLWLMIVGCQLLALWLLVDSATLVRCAHDHFVLNMYAMTIEVVDDDYGDNDDGSYDKGMTIACWQVNRGSTPRLLRRCSW